MPQHLDELGLPPATVAWMNDRGIRSVSDFALHFFDPEQQALLVAATKIDPDLVCSLVQQSLSTIPTEVWRECLQQSQSSHATGVDPRLLQASGHEATDCLLEDSP